MAESIQDVSWAEAWGRAARMLDGVERRQLAGASPEISLSLLDWGGSGELVVLHHANGFCAATLAPVAHALRDRYRVLSIDARGHGDSARIPPGDDGAAYGWECLARDLTAAVQQILAETGRRSVRLGIGHSFGGALMLRAAAWAPSFFEQLLLCDPVILPPMTPAERAGHSGGSQLAVITRRRRDRFPSREAAFEHFRSRGLFGDMTPEALALYVAEGLSEMSSGEVALKCAREVEAAIFDGGARSPEIEGLEKVTAEVLFVHALRGNFSKPFYDEVAGRIERARVESHDGGHLFPLEEPDRLLSLVEERIG